MRRCAERGLRRMCERIGLLGGSFNPIHLGHLAMAAAAREELGLTRLLIMPDGDPPHKSTELADKAQRLEMVRRAAGDRFEVSAMEVDRPGKTYTIDTLTALREAWPQAALVMLIGADTLRELPTWREAQRVYALCRFAVFARDELALCAPPGVQWIRMRTEIPDISSTEIRARVHKGLSLDGLVPQVVQDYIGAHRLYDPPRQRSQQTIRRRLKEMLPAKRYRHTLGVKQAMIRLAQRWSYDAEKAALTGLLHDCAKAMPLAQMQAYVRRVGVHLDALRQENTALLHAPAGAALARERFGVTDPEILHAIATHNTGSEKMGILDKLLFVADYTEPGRKAIEGLDAIRAMAMEDLDAAVCGVLDSKLAYITQKGDVLHPDTLAARKAIECAKHKEETA